MDSNFPGRSKIFNLWALCKAFFDKYGPYWFSANIVFAKQMCSAYKWFRQNSIYGGVFNGIVPVSVVGFFGSVFSVCATLFLSTKYYSLMSQFILWSYGIIILIKFLDSRSRTDFM